jgi:DNA (cytosine-5)-methyltransferase 1
MKRCSANGTSRKFDVVGVDLFCGVGGLTHGLMRGGVRVAAGYDIDPACRYPFEANNGAAFVESDVADLSPEEILPHYEGAAFTLLAGCAPCQPFSTYSRSGRNGEYESQWPLVSSFGRLVKELRPHLVTMENVPQLANHPVFQRLLTDLSDYDKWWTILDCATIGVPQTRKRLVLLASRLGKKALELRKQTPETATVRQAIGTLPRIGAGECHSDDSLHMASSLSSLNLSRIRVSRPGGTWRDWPSRLRNSCHRRESGSTYPSVYGRMEWDQPAPTITTQCFGYGNGRFGHPEQDRAISLREAAMLQTFPASYKFSPPGASVKFNNMGRLIGNAVPVRVGEVIAESLVAHVRACARLR